MSITLTQHDGIALLELSYPPVNALGIALRRALTNTFEQLRTDDRTRAVIVCGSGAGFSAGGDRSEFGRPEASERPTLSRDVLAAIQACGKPVIAAIHGFAVGGGLEFALACHCRVATSDARIGLPETGLGRFPLSGSQRLPRLLGLESAAEWMMNARMTTAGDATAAPIFDRVVQDRAQLIPAAMELANRAIESTPRLIDDRPLPDADPAASMRRIEALHPEAGRSPAQIALLRALHAAATTKNFGDGLERAQVLFDELTGQT